MFSIAKSRAWTSNEDTMVSGIGQAPIKRTEEFWFMIRKPATLVSVFSFQDLVENRKGLLADEKLLRIKHFP